MLICKKSPITANAKAKRIRKREKLLINIINLVLSQLLICILVESVYKSIKEKQRKETTTNMAAQNNLTYVRNWRREPHKC